MSIKECPRKAPGEVRGATLGYEGPLYGQLRNVPYSSLGLETHNLTELWCGKVGALEMLRRLQMENDPDNYNLLLSILRTP